MQRARLVLRKPRQERVDMVRQYVGMHWSEEGATKPVPCNLLATYCSIIGPRLVANNPRAMLSTSLPQVAPIVRAMEDWVNKEIERIDLANTLQRVVLDALFSIGICKVGIATAAEGALYSWHLAPGEPYAQRVDLDDFVFDVHARDFNECGFIGHRYRIPLRVARILYGKNRDLTVSDDSIYNLEGDERINVLGRTTLAGNADGEFEEMVDLWEVYLPRHRRIVTLHDAQVASAFSDESGKWNTKALDVKDWLGPDAGPYHLLCFSTVPGNIMPKGPIQDLYDLANAINRVLRKLIYSADNFKDLVFVQGGADEDGGRVVKANHLEVTRVDNPGNIARVQFGGADAGLYQFFSGMRELYSWLAGNLEIAGGLSPQSKTLGQDEMLQQASSTTLSDMQDKVIRLATRVVQALCWFWHHDPRRVMRITHSIPGQPALKIFRSLHPPGQAGPGRMARDHNFEDLEVKVDPYALQHQTPQQRLQQLNELVSQILGPLLPLFQQQGKVLDVEAYLQKVAKYMDSPDLPEIITVAEPPQEGDGAAPEPPGMPANTTRNYNRHSQGSATQGGSELQRINAMRTAQNGTPVQGAA